MGNLKTNRLQMLNKIMFMSFFPVWKVSFISIKFYVPFISLNTEHINIVTEPKSRVN